MGELDRVGTLTNQILDVMEHVLWCAAWGADRGGELESDSAAMAGGTKQTRDYLVALAELLTEAVPLERTRIGQEGYESDYGTQLEFSDPKYQLGDWSLRIVRMPLKRHQPRMSVMDKLDVQAKARPRVWLHSARGAVLTYAAEFWLQCVETFQPLRKSRGYADWPLDLPTGQKLLVDDDIFEKVRSWLSWARMPCSSWGRRYAARMRDRGAALEWSPVHGYLVRVPAEQWQEGNSTCYGDDCYEPLYGAGLEPTPTQAVDGWDGRRSSS